MSIYFDGLNEIESQDVKKWIIETIELCKPSYIEIIDGTEIQLDRLRKEALKACEIEKLNDELPNCFIARSDPNDVARSEARTFICADSEDEVGPTNNYMNSKEAYKKIGKIFEHSMQNRTMYVIPFMMGMPNSEFYKLGIEITDSIYVVLNMSIMARVGKIALNLINNGEDFTKCLHSKKDLKPEDRYIAHFPKDNTIWSINSAYGGNALLGKKCMGLRIASYMAKNEGWLAEHMLILEIENPNGEKCYIGAAFPSACGKTNLAMLTPPSAFSGYKVRTIGDDLAWIRIRDGKLWAINPETGFFGVAPGTSKKTNPNAMACLSKDTIFTNVVKTVDNKVWWEGMDNEVTKGIDWKGKPWERKNGELGAHPNARFTAPIKNCPSLSQFYEDPNGVPLSAIIFGGRRSSVIPLVYEAFDWERGVYIGASMASETTAASDSKLGRLRRDPFAMIPFCGYNMGEYFKHWLNIGASLFDPPKIFSVNWFKTDENGKIIWPGFGENLRILEWIMKRSSGQISAKKSKIGWLPFVDDINLDGIGISKETLSKLLLIDDVEFKREVEQQEEFFEMFGDKFPYELGKESKRLKKEFGEFDE